MGAERIEQVIQALNAAGIRAERGYPNRKMPALTASAVAVSLEEQTRETVRITAKVYCRGEMGGVTCEDQTLAVAAVLKGIGGNCVVGSCRFQEEIGLFCAEVAASWPQIPPVTVLVDETALQYVTAVTARQSWETIPDENGIEVTKKGWAVFVEQMLPPESMLMEPDTVGFDITLIHATGREVYSNCYWDSVTSQIGVDGVLRKREAWTWNAPTLTQAEQ